MTSENNEQTAPKSAPEPVGNLWELRGSFPIFIDFLVLFGIFFLSQLVALAVAWCFGLNISDLSAALRPDAVVDKAAQLRIGYFNALTYVISMGLTVGGFVWYRRARHAAGRMARFSKRGLNPLLLLWGLLFTFATAIVIEPLFALLPDVPDIYGRGGWLFLMLVVAAPLLEEFLCRGVLLESLRAKYGVIAAVVVSAVCFGILHLQPALMVNAFVLGLIFGFIYIRSGSLWTTIILHAANNALAYLMMTRGVGSLTDAIGSRWLYVLIYIVAAAVFVIAGYRTLGTLKQLDAEDKNRAKA